LPGDLHIENGQLSNVVTLNLSGLDLKALNLVTLIDSLGSLQQLHLDDVKVSVSPSDLAHAASANTTSGLKELSMRHRCSIVNGRFDTFLANILFRSKLADLVILELSDFDLTSLSLHALIHSLGNLRKLYLENVKISASTTDLPHASSANKSSGLKELSMRQCTITSGRFDTVLTKLPLFHNLIKLDLSVPNLQNLSLDALINNLGSLQKLYLDFVNISVSPIRSVHASINTTPVLQELSMINCGLTGTFPSWIFHIKSLTVLDVSGNENLCGELPEFIEGSSLQELRLSGTKFSGKIPESIRNLRNLTMLDLSYCQFRGLVPPFAHIWAKIRVVDLSSNNLTGSLPSHGSLPLHNLTKLVLTNNSISGEIPAYLFSHPSLEYLDLSLNNFTGNFLLNPNVSSNLAYLDLS
jgi:Leucine-rich repeat (LRR) protein